MPLSEFEYLVLLYAKLKTKKKWLMYIGLFIIRIITHRSKIKNMCFRFYVLLCRVLQLLIKTKKVMAKLSQGILGGISGKVGSVIGSSWKGIPVIRIKPVSVADRKSAAQLAQRTSFSLAVEMSKQVLSSFIKPIWDRFQTKQSGYNAFVSNLLGVFKEGYSYSNHQLIVAYGQMEAQSPLTAVLSNGGQDLAITWTAASVDPFALDDDEVYFLAVSQSDNGKWYAGKLSGTRSTGAGTYTTSAAMQLPGTVTVHLVFRRVDGSIVSTSGVEVFDGIV